MMFANEFEYPDIAGDDMTIKRLEALIRDCNCQIEAMTYKDEGLRSVEARDTGGD
mgnify:CR=1 FL=1